MSSSEICGSSPISRVRGDAGRGHERDTYSGVENDSEDCYDRVGGDGHIIAVAPVAGLCNAADYSPTTETIAPIVLPDCSQGRSV